MSPSSFHILEDTSLKLPLSTYTSHFPMNLKYLQQNNPKKSSIKTKQKLGIINEKGVIAVPETEDEIITEI